MGTNMPREIDRKILNLLRDNPKRFSEICRKLRINEVRAYRRLKTLEAQGYVIKDKQTGLWKTVDLETLFKLHPEINIEGASEKAIYVMDEAIGLLAEQAHSPQYRKYAEILLEHGLHTAKCLLLQALMAYSVKPTEEERRKALAKYMEDYLATYLHYLTTLINETPKSLHPILDSHWRMEYEEAKKALEDFMLTLEGASPSETMNKMEGEA
jgi:DNA-binding Lrp family transcriptional regulator